MAVEVNSYILGVDTILGAKDENMDMVKLEKEFQEGLATVFAEIKDIELRSKDEISHMTTEEFFLELEILDKQYESKIKLLLEKQIAKKHEEKKLEEKKEVESKKDQKAAFVKSVLHKELEKNEMIKADLQKSTDLRSNLYIDTKLSSVIRKERLGLDPVHDREIISKLYQEEIRQLNKESKIYNAQSRIKSFKLSLRDAKIGSQKYEESLNGLFKAEQDLSVLESSG
jgi:hypothetical protein